MPAPEGTQVFISYSHKDKEWLNRLLTTLDPLRRYGLISVWDDTQIRPGSQWEEEIQKALAAAKIVVLLVSPNFLASDFIVNNELAPSLKAAAEEGPTILWVAVRECLYTETPITKFQAANNPAKPLDSLRRRADRDAELVKIALKIKAAARQTITPKQIPGKLLIDQQPVEPEMVLISAGEFLMGSDPQQDENAFEKEQPQHRLYLPDYYLAKTPVTNAQYRAFVLSTGHTAPEVWTDRAPRRGEEDHPVTDISWYDAMAYCWWLSEKTGKAYGLPSEAEWEKGARGTDGRIYPWGNQWDATRCNSKESGLGNTTSVQAYPQGASPYGLLDMAGNGLEWTRSLWGKRENKPDYGYPYESTDGRENPDAGPEELRVLRSGAFYDDRRNVRCASHFGWDPRSSRGRLGVRVVMPPAS